MAYYDRDYFQEEQRPGTFQTPSMGRLSKSLAIGLAVLCVVSIPLADSFSAADALRKMTGSPILKDLALTHHVFWPFNGIGPSPWQIITAPLIPSSIISAIMTGVFAIWLIGSQLESALGRRRYGKFLLVAVLLGSLASALIDPLLAGMFTNTGEVYSLGMVSLSSAIFMGAAAAMPNARTLFSFKFSTVCFALILLSALMSAWDYTSGRDGIMVVTSLPGILAGAGFGWYGIKWMDRRGMVRVAGRTAKRTEGPEDYLAYAKRISGEEELVKVGPDARSPATARREREQKRKSKIELREIEEKQAVDELLARISSDGINSLSKSEHAFLERVSRRKRQEGK